MLNLHYLLLMLLPVLLPPVLLPPVLLLLDWRIPNHWVIACMMEKHEAIDLVQHFAYASLCEGGACVLVILSQLFPLS